MVAGACCKYMNRPLIMKEHHFSGSTSPPALVNIAQMAE